MDTPKTFTTTQFAFVQDDGEQYFDRYNIGTANYKIGKTTRSRANRVKAQPVASDIKSSSKKRKEF